MLYIHRDDHVSEISPLEVLRRWDRTGNRKIELAFKDDDDDNYVIHIIFTARTKEAEYDKFGKQDVVVISSVVPDQLVIGSLSCDSYIFITSISDDVNKANGRFEEGKAAYFNQTLESSHVSAWSDIWQGGRIDLIGNVNVSRITYSALYYILSSIPDSLQDQKSFDYYGHVFWDQETWMFPPVLMLHTDLGKALVKTRIRTLDSAKGYACSRGYAGAMYTWESDVALAFQQYLRMTNDKDFLFDERGAEAVENIADFWACNATMMNTSILLIIPCIPTQ
ncbi:LOW QUALITY PROTEIN: hypothetical protein KUTeg_013288 [Tegillarca granosa]|uniref:Glycoside hydrolase family 65 central catalytic domain-containing protein n=1 Tax=Tegillarca granosa TaxID=220873 RepID=A0ABQ9ETM5_TEGGR|nr:LOW QUALITY PROTEIN: hypothetical protein KUTeg_013288 [Tegillarca granosa]